MTSISTFHRRACLSGFALALATLCVTAAAQAYPAKTVRIINNFPPGGPADVLARSMADALQASLKQPFIVENKAGAGGNIGADQVAKSTPDGYTLLVGIDSTFTVNPHLYKAMPFKAEDFKPLMVMASSGLMVGAAQATGFKTLKDLVAAAKTRTLNFSNAGSGSPGHLALEIFKDAAGVLATPGLLPHVKAGKITALAVTSRQRSRLAPEVPTVAEAGLKELEQDILYVAMVPAATPEAVVQTLQKAMMEAFKRPDVQARLAGLDLAYEGLVGEAARKRMADLSRRYAAIVKSTGMQAE